MSKNDLYLHDMKCVGKKWPDQLMNKFFSISLGYWHVSKINITITRQFFHFLEKIFWYDISISLKEKEWKDKKVPLWKVSLMKRIIRSKKRKLKWLNNWKIPSINSV